MSHGFGVKTLVEPADVAALPLFGPTFALPVALPSRVSYEADCLSPVPDQRSYGTCVAFGSSALLEYWHKVKHGLHERVSARAAFSRARATYAPGDLADDGLSVYQGARTLERGWTTEQRFPYSAVHSFQALLEPVPVDLVRRKLVLLQYFQVGASVDDMRAALHAAGPLLIGLNWNGHWVDAQIHRNDNTLPPPRGAGGDGHCVLIVGYDDNRAAFRVRNSWGATWADHGHCWLPYVFSKRYEQNWPANRYTAIAQ